MSSVTPSPIAPIFLTSKTPVELLAFPSSDGLEGSGANELEGSGERGLEGSGARGSVGSGANGLEGSGARGLEGSGEGKGGAEISDIW